MSRRAKLTEKQKRIVTLIADGYDVQGIATEMGLGKWTIRDHVRRLCRTYDCSFKDLPARTGLKQRSRNGD